MSDQNPIWEKIDHHAREIGELKSFRDSAEYRIAQIESRIEMLLRDNAKATGELVGIMKELQKELSAVRDEQIKQQAREEERQKSSGKVQAWVPIAISVIMMLLALGWINGVKAYPAQKNKIEVKE